VKIITDHPLAEWSPDHIHPKGTATDSTTNAGFNRKLFALIPGVSLLDLGCAGGGLVASIIYDHGFAIGVDGSDYSKQRSRASWSTIPGNLFTADITHPFTLEDDKGNPVLFDVVTAWEVLEHIPESSVEAMMSNVERHLSPEGLFICSISQSRDHWEGFDYHVTIEQRPWWIGKLGELGWRERPELNDYFTPDWVRGPDRGMDSFAMVVSK
jgi:cyclopropane fatty-acyl-phospholipid synthase-like methyltransferase